MSADRPMTAPLADLDEALRDLGMALAVPTPDASFVARVSARLDVERPRRAGVAWWAGLGGGARPLRRSIRRSVLLAAAALLVAAALVAAAIGWGLPGLQILVGPVATPSAPAGSGAPSGAPGATLGLGTPLTLEAATALIDFEVVLPPDPALGPPEAVYLAGRRLALAWGEGPGRPGTAVPGLGLLLVEIHATVDEGMIRKIVDSGTPVEAVEVDGAPGYWISGKSHELLFIDPDGEVIPDSQRLSGNTLVWTVGGVTFRLEGDFDRSEALALASSLR